MSRATGVQGIKGNGPSYGTISADGGLVAFQSSADNLDPADTDGVEDIFVRDLRTHETTLVSRADGVDGAKGNGWSRISAVSADGRYVLFVSAASNLDPADGDERADVYLRDRLEHDAVLVSRASGGAKANDESERARISADGRYVVFSSSATNLDPADTNADRDIFMRDLRTGATTLATPEPGHTELAALSADGRHVAYTIPASPEDEWNERGTLYVRDLAIGSVDLASRADGPAGDAANGVSRRSGVALSADGRFVVFSSLATNLDRADRDDIEDVYVRDLVAGETTLVSRAAGVDGVKSNQESWGGSLSADGRYVAFSSSGWNLDPLDRRYDHQSEIFVRDLRTHRLSLANRTNSGVKGDDGDGGSHLPSLSADGRYVAFTSDSENLHAGFTDLTDDINSEWLNDVFVRDLSAPEPIPGRRPRSRIASIRRTKDAWLIVGSARDDHRLQRVELSLARRIRTPRGRLCQTVQDERWVNSPRAGRRCAPRFHIQALSTRRWRARLPRNLAAGTYTLSSRATDTAGQRERRFSVRRGNVRTFRVPG